MKRTQKIRTCNRLHLGKRGFWLIVPKNLPKSRLVWGPIWVILVHCRKQVQRHLRATFHTRLRAHDHYTSSTLIGGKHGDGPSSLHTTLEGPTEFVTARWMSSLHGFLHGIEWIMFHNHLDYFKYPSLGDRPNTKLGDHGILNNHNHWFFLIYHVWGLTWIEIPCNSIWLRARSHMASHYT